YQADRVYGLATVIFFLSTILIFSIIHVLSRTLTPASRKVAGFKARKTFRYLCYKNYTLLGINTPPLGVMILIGLGAVVFLCLMLGPQPYYWPNSPTKSYGDSPPIATRSGWMALAMLPFLLALAAKANLITALTGVPHEKLQVYHQWVAYAMLVLALVHTFPFVVYNASQHGLQEQWRTSVFWWTGVILLLSQAWLTFASYGPLRRRFYEFFKATHLIAALVFVIFFFLHCDFTLTSVDYFIAAAGVYLVPLAFAWVRGLIVFGLKQRAILTPLPGGMVKISISVDGEGKWRPGQHVFIRFFTLGLHAATAHPFSVCSVAHGGEEGTGKSDMVLYIQPAGGLTARLASMAQQTPGCSVAVGIEGAYGGLAVRDLSQFDKVLLIGGGSGAGFILGLIEDLLHRASGERRVKNARVVLASRRRLSKEWYNEELRRLGQRYPQAKDVVQVTWHETDDTQYIQETVTAGKKSSSDLGERGESGDEKEASLNMDVKQGRPILPELIRGETERSAEESIAIIVCGPSGMAHDVRGAAANAQRRSGEVYLHVEGFS
ncbi:ferric-chelate reductase, partial [Plectosphaerella cucumerina]